MRRNTSREKEIAQPRKKNLVYSSCGNGTIVIINSVFKSILLSMLKQPLHHIYSQVKSLEVDPMPEVQPHKTGMRAGPDHIMNSQDPKILL